MVNIVSACCQASIETVPVLDDPRFGTYYGMDVCGECGAEADPIHTCEYCGAELNGDNPAVRVGDEERCYACLGVYMTA